MKTQKQIFAIALTTLLMLLLTAITTQSQIQFEGYAYDNEGSAAWDADGTGPEPAAIGHNVPLTGYTNQPYYGASRDYIDTNPNAAGFHLTSINSGFPMFSQALTDNGFTIDQIKVKFGLSTLGDDIEGIDWLIMGSLYYTNYYDLELIFELNGEPMISGNMSYANFSNIDNWTAECSFTKPIFAAGASSAEVQAVANALLQDFYSFEMQITYKLTTATFFSGNNGRTGRYMNIFDGTLEKEAPNIPFQGLATDHEGTVAWDADGTGPEPLRNGHGSYGYFGASRDYDGIDPDPNAAFGHFLDNSEGFINFYLQMEYRGYTPDQIKIKAGKCSLDEDIEGEDWFGEYNLNYYQALMNVEMNGEPLFGFMLDTLNFIHQSTWNIITSPAIAYDASENSSTDIQFIADAFFKDLGIRQLQMEFEMSLVSGTINSNGRDGVLYQIDEGNLVAKESNCTRVYEGDVSGQWHANCSPYIIEGDITVPTGETLTIEPGVWVKFMDRYPISVQGSVVAEGDGTNTGDIVFTAVNPEKGWDGFDMDSTTATESVSFDHCIFEYGYAYGENALNSGGAIAVEYFDHLTIDHCLFRHNWADQPGTYPPSGGAIGLWESSPSISNSIFSNNTADFGGAIMCYSGSNPEISKCLFYNNAAGQDGGAVEMYLNCEPILSNNTFSLNTAVQNGGAVDAYLNSEPIFNNNIFWGNDATVGKQISVTSNNCNVSLTYCNIQSGEAGIGPYGIGSGTYENNLETDPVFAVPLAWNFQLADASPCINTGDPTLFDPDGTISDMGAFYYSIPPAPVAIEGEEITNTSFYAKWEMDFAVTGYLLDVATDADFTNLVPGYDNLDVGYTYIVLVELPLPTVYYYRVRAHNAAGTSDNSNTIEIDLATGIEEALSGSKSDLVLAPNPITSWGNIQLELTTGSQLYIDIYNYTGQKVFSLSPGKQQQGLVSIPLDLSSLLPGSYICRVTTDKSVQTSKFIKN